MPVVPSQIRRRALLSTVRPFLHRLIASVTPRTRQLRLLAIAGTAAGCLIVVAGSRVGLARSATPFTSWLGLLARTPVNPRHSALPGLLLALGVCAFVAVWLFTLRAMRDRGHALGQWWVVSCWWAAPFLLGPPLLSSDVFSYAAQGMLVAHGHDPYSSGPSALGWGPTLAAVDPSWRSEPSPYGPLATVVEHLSVVLGGGTALGAVIVLRLFAAGSVIAIGVLAMHLAGTERAAAALGLTILNPLLLMHVIGGVHFEGLMCALLLATIYTANRGQLYLALMLGCAAGAIKAPALVVVLAIVFLTLMTAQAGRGHELRNVLWRCAGVVAACWLVFTLLVPHGWGWLRSLGTPALTSTPAAVSTLLSGLMSLVVPPPSAADAAYACRVTALFAAVVITGYLLVTAHHRPLAKTTGLALLALSLLSPVFYPWYAVWGLICLAPVVAGRPRDWLVALSALAVTVNLPGLTTPRAAVFDTLVAIAVAVPMLRLTRADLRGTRHRVEVAVARTIPLPGGAARHGHLVNVSRQPAVSQRNDDWIASTPTPVAKIMNSTTDANTTKL
jgi:hypothetical protein